MASGAFEFPGGWLVEDTGLSSSFWPGRDHAGLHAPESALAALGGEHGGDAQVRRQRPEMAAAGPGPLKIGATPAHPHINHPVCSNADSWPQTQSEDSQ